MPSLPPLLLFASILLAQSPAPIPTFADEFNGRELDLSRWSPHEPRARAQAGGAIDGNGVEVKGGQLRIIVPAPRAGEDHDTHETVSATVTSFGTFAQTYGRFEIRCRVPAGPALRARFRLLPIPLGSLPEIEVFETNGSNPSRVTFANRWGTEQTDRSFGDSFSAPDLSAGFHMFAIEWDRDRIAWFVDGKQMFRSVDGIPHQPMYLVLDIAGAPAASSTPASFDIDYIRVYAHR
jgi:beta-glucanase (GH16 family)